MISILYFIEENDILKNSKFNCQYVNQLILEVLYEVIYL